MVIGQYEIWWINLDPTKGSEIRKIRPCVIISPNEMNRHIRTVLIAPMTSTSKRYPSRIRTVFEEREGWIVLDQIRCVDKQRLLKHAGTLDNDAVLRIKQTLQEILVD